MRSYLLITVLSLTICMGINQTAFAVCTEGPPDTFTCDTNPPNPDPDGVQQDSNANGVTVNMTEGSAIDTTLQPGLNLQCIDTGPADNTYNLIGASMKCQNDGIEGNIEIDEITMRNSSIESITNVGIEIGAGNDIVDIGDSLVTSVENDALNTGNGDDTVTVSGSELKVLTASGNDSGIQLTFGNDTLFVETSVIQGGRSNGPIPNAIDLGGEDDVLTLGNGVELLGVLSGDEIVTGNIDCGLGFDTIIFAIDVPDDLLNRLSLEILRADPAGDTIVINNLTYTWTDCELLVNELNGVPLEPRPIPTLSQWGLIAMAGLIGIIGLLAVRRRAVAS